MYLYILDPLVDDRWNDLAASHPKASVFHQTGWLKALAKTYGYQSLVLTSTPPGKPLTDGLVFCEVKSWVTGDRLVSLPFTDHVEPLMNESQAAFGFAKWIRCEPRRLAWKYVEIRPLSENLQDGDAFIASRSFWLHTLDLTAPLDDIFRRFHKSCIQRRIGHAERQALTYEKGRSQELLEEFYRLLVITRRRLHLLPQPRAWFRNLIDCLSSNAEIRLVRKDRKAVAALFTLRHCDTLVYKYGCSDEEFHHLGGMPFLFWKLIEESKLTRAKFLDLGRTDLDDDGLITFKDRLGASRTRLTYFRHPEGGRNVTVALNSSVFRRVCFVLPSALSSTLGRMAYRHIG